MEREKYIARVTLIGSLVNFLLLIFKFAAGILGRSSAMIADAVHSLSDFASDLILLLCIRVASKPEDDDHAYGHGKFETLAAVCIGLILLATGFGLFWSALRDCIDFFYGRQLARPGWLALAAAIISIIIKEGLYHYTIRAAKKADSEALKVNAWHHRSDAISSIATVIGIGCARLPGDYWAVFDPLAACVISIFIIVMAFSLMKPGLEELLEKSLPVSEIRKIEKILASCPGVVGYHRIRTRRLGVNRAVEAHIKLDGGISLIQAHEIASAAEKAIKAEWGQNTHVGIHMEPEHGNNAPN